MNFADIPDEEHLPNTRSERYRQANLLAAVSLQSESNTLSIDVLSESSDSCLY
jgi:hypothetical protein